MSDELREDLRVLGATQAQIHELLCDPQRAEGWVEWARWTGKGIGPVLYQFRTGEQAPDAEAFYKREPGVKRRPDYKALLQACESLVRNTGHVYDDPALLEEFSRLSRNPRVGNGARLLVDDLDRLLQTAKEMREREPDTDT
jgi:hypothetical protein